ncbi:MAG: hypothetical protein ACLSFT_11890 [Ruminococcus callidus]
MEGCIISSVVPSINHAVRKAVEKIAHCPVVLVGWCQNRLTDRH